MKLIATTALAFLCASTAFAHSQLKSAVPAEGASVSSPREIDLSFSEDLNLSFSGVTVVGPNESKVDTGKPRLEDDGKRLVIDIPKPLAPGSYRVDWHVLSNDGHKTKGSIAFTVTP